MPIDVVTMPGLALFLVTLLMTLPPGGTFVDDDGSLFEGEIEAIAAADITVGGPRLDE